MNSWGHHLLVMFSSSSLWDRELLLTSILSSVYWITSIAFRFNIVGQVTRQFSEAPFLPSIFSINGLTIPSFLLQWAGTASIDFSLAQLIQVIVLLSTGGNNGGGYLASKYVVFAFHAVILLSHAIINSLSITWLSFFGQIAALLEYAR